MSTRRSNVSVSLMMFLARWKSVSRTWSPAVQPVSTPSAAAMRCRPAWWSAEADEVFGRRTSARRAVHLEPQEVPRARPVKKPIASSLWRKRAMRDRTQPACGLLLALARSRATITRAVADATSTALARFAILARISSRYNRMPGGVALIGRHVIFARPTPETEFLNEIDFRKSAGATHDSTLSIR